MWKKASKYGRLMVMQIGPHNHLLWWFQNFFFGILENKIWDFPRKQRSVDCATQSSHYQRM